MDWPSFWWGFGMGIVAVALVVTGCLVAVYQSVRWVEHYWNGMCGGWSDRVP